MDHEARTQRLTFRTPQLRHGTGALLAVLHLLCPGSLAAEQLRSAGRAATISPDGALRNLDAAQGSARRAPPAAPGPRAPLTTGSPPSAARDSSFLALSTVGRRVSARQFPFDAEDLGIGQATPEPTPPPTEFLLFTWDAGGSWDGARNDFTGEIGFAFIPQKDFNITAIGRHVRGSWEHGLNLFQETNVTLWWKPPDTWEPAAGYDRSDVLRMASVKVGPDDKGEVGGKYKFKYLETPIPVLAHQEYRITQSCWKGMDDVWFDGIADDTDIWQYSLIECAKVTEGVHSERMYEYPDRVEKLHKHLGMLNVRLDSPEGCGVAIPVNTQD